MSAAVETHELFRIHRSAEGDAAALQGLSMRVEAGEVVAVVGPSGAGKSTLLRILAALEQPSAGQASVLGEDVGRLHGRRAAAFRARQLGLVDQHYHRALTPELRCRELVGLQLALRGAPRAERCRRAADLLERVGLAEAADALPRELSGGEQQRVAVCAAVAHRPRLLLADEPAGELDAANAAEVYRLLTGLAREDGATVVFVSHDPATAEVADRTLAIRDGRLSDEATGTRPGSIVVGKGGWLRVPEELLREAGIATRARAELFAEGVLLRPAGSLAGAAAPSGGATEAGGLAERGSSAPAGEAAAAVFDVRKAYGRGRRARVVFDGLTFAARVGRLTALTGRSGSGKSTLLRLLAGLERPDSGEVVVLGETLSRRSRAELARMRRAGVAVVTQQPDLVPFLSARENVELALDLRGTDNDERESTARRWLSRLGLEHRVEQRVERLSAGEAQRVAIARALAASPALLLLDEPSSRLDQANAALVGHLLAAAAGEGATIVCATHEPLIVEQADDVLALEGVAPGRARARA